MKAAVFHGTGVIRPDGVRDPRIERPSAPGRAIKARKTFDHRGRGWTEVKPKPSSAAAR